MKSYGLTLVLYDQFPNEKRLGHSHEQKEDHMRTQGEDSCLQAKERGLGGKQPCLPLGVGLPAEETMLDLRLPLADLWLPWLISPFSCGRTSESCPSASPKSSELVEITQCLVP